MPIAKVSENWLVASAVPRPTGYRNWYCFRWF